jgi:inner membrane protease subunit 2
MSPTLNPAYHESGNRDYVLINKDLLLDRLERGMIVTFQNPTKDPRSLAVKRIIALEGDTVKTKKPAIFDKVVIPKGHVWVEGDFEESQDCNTYGPVRLDHRDLEIQLTTFQISANLVYGHVTRVLWPPERAGRLAWEDWKDTGRVHRRSATDQWDEEWL